MILAGDIGGTSTRLGLFDPARPRPRQLAIQVFTTLDFPDLPSMIAAFLQAGSIDRATIDRACFGVAGPVVDDAARLTNVPWRVDGRTVAKALALKRVSVLNDLSRDGVCRPRARGCRAAHAAARRTDPPAATSR